MDLQKESEIRKAMRLDTIEITIHSSGGSFGGFDPYEGDMRKEQAKGIAQQIAEQTSSRAKTLHTQEDLQQAINKLYEVIPEYQPPFKQIYEDMKMIEKTDGNGNTIMVEDPDQINAEGGFRKIRRKPTNYTPPKKKRKKRK